jgi:alpha-galactosidase
MAVLAEQIRGRGVLPGIWVRPLRAGSATRRSWLLPASRFGRLQGNDALAFDPTVPDALNEALSVVREARDWGYNLIKHDYTTYELLGQWGSQMGASPTIDGWSFYDRSRTNAEIISQLYRDIRTAAGEDRIIVGCNTVGHLAAGIFDAQRTGDDVSGRAWDRTRRMGVNTLAFRLPQHRILYANDPDCVPITQNVPWSFTEQWLRAAAASGTVLLVSPEPGSVGQEQMRALRSAFALCATGKANSEPLDWMTSSTPEKWSNGAGHVRYAWTESGGVSPFAEGM